MRLNSYFYKIAFQLEHLKKKKLQILFKRSYPRSDIILQTFNLNFNVLDSSINYADKNMINALVVVCDTYRNAKFHRRKSEY